MKIEDLPEHQNAHCAVSSVYAQQFRWVDLLRLLSSLRKKSRLKRAKGCEVKNEYTL